MRRSTRWRRSITVSILSEFRDLMLMLLSELNMRNVLSFFQVGSPTPASFKTESRAIEAA